MIAVILHIVVVIVLVIQVNQPLSLTFFRIIFPRNFQGLVKIHFLYLFQNILFDRCGDICFDIGFDHLYVLLQFVLEL
jgi:hypothetical protein